MRSLSLLVTISYYSIPSGMLGRGPHTLSTGCSRLPPASARPSLPLPAAAEAQRSVACAVGGEGGLVPTSHPELGTTSGRRAGVEGRRSAVGRPGSGTRSLRRESLPPPNHALEPTAPSGCLCPLRAAVPGGGGSPRAFGG
jgi:hypothetical protein